MNFKKFLGAAGVSLMLIGAGACGDDYVPMQLVSPTDMSVMFTAEKNTLTLYPYSEGVSLKILGGEGRFVIDNSDDKVVSYQYDGETLRLMPEGVGSAVITITDRAGGVFELTVNVNYVTASYDVVSQSAVITGEDMTQGEMAKLTAEKGLFNFSAGTTPTDGEAYTLWIDDVRYEYISTLAHTRIESMSMAGFPTGDIEISELTAYINLPNGVDQKMSVSSRYFTFDSSNHEVATVEENVITFHGVKDRAVLTPREAEGAITITGIYDFAPVPTHDPSNVVSLFCDDYENTLTSPMNGYWAPYQTTTSNQIVLGDDINIMHYGSFNFVGIVFDDDADTTGKTHLHMDVLLQDKVENAQIDVSADRSATSGDNAGKVTVSLKSGEWVSIDVPLNGATVIHQLQLAVTSGTPAYSDILVDNIYFY